MDDTPRAEVFKPYLMYIIGQIGDILLKPYMEQYKKDEHIYVMFVYGEPDVRIHFDKQINTLKRDEDEVINTLCENYIDQLVKICPPNVTIIIRYLLPQRENSMYGEYVPQGTLIDRIRYTDKVNKKLKTLCHGKNLLFF